MADRAVIAVFDTQNQAYDAAADLQRLADDGTIDLKRGAIVTKDAKGNLTIPDSRDVGAPWGLLGCHGCYVIHSWRAVSVLGSPSWGPPV